MHAIDAAAVYGLFWGQDLLTIHSFPFISIIYKQQFFITSQTNLIKALLYI